MLFFVMSEPTYAAVNCDVDYSSDTDPPMPVQILCPAIKVINYAIVIVGAVFTVMVVFTGYRYYTSFGDPKGLEGAKSSFVHAVLGLVIVVGSFTTMVLLVNILGLAPSTANPVEGAWNGICNLLMCSSPANPIVDMGSLCECVL